MSIKNYFSKDPDKRALFIFSFIAGIYGKADTNLSKGFWESTKVLEDEIGIKGKSVLDIGSGSGAWSANFLRMGAKRVEGVDFAPKMIAQAKKKHPDIKFQQGNAEDLSQFADNTFDIVTASFVLHGVKKDKRAKMLQEMKRISKGHVVLHDFIGKTPLFVRFLEFMEQSDYKNFKEHFCSELQEYFKETSKIATRFGSGLYIAR
ncbi:MAG: methyltransferase domain-containing protein [Bacteroidales bacterium]|nr:methyltransferase domain-containing protein [Bacteroidales bacterium]